MATPALLGISADVYNDLVNEVFEVLKDGSVTLGEIVHLGGKMANKVCPSLDLSLDQKKELVLEILEKGIDRVEKEVLSVLSDSQKSLFSGQFSLAVAHVKEAVPAVLDVTVNSVKSLANLVDLNKSFSLLPFGVCCGGGLLPLEPSLVKNFQEKIKSVQDDVQEQVKSVQEQVQQQVQAVQEQVQQQVQAVQEQVQQQVQAVQEVVEEQVQAVQEVVEEQVQAVQEVVEEQVQAVQEVVEEQVQAVQEVVEEQVQAVQEQVQEQVQAVQEQVQEQLETVQEVVEEQLQATEESVNLDMTSMIPDPLSDESAKVEEPLSNMVSEENLDSTVSDIPENKKD